MDGSAQQHKQMDGPQQQVAGGQPQQQDMRPGRPGVNTIFLKNPFSQAAIGGAKAVAIRAGGAVTSFRTKPGQSSALLLGYLSWLFLFVATFTNWWYYATRGVGSLKVWGEATLFTMQTCFDAQQGRDTWTAGEFCSVTALADIALKLDYFRVAGAVAFAFVLFALILVATANWFANMRRRDELDQRIHVRLGGLKSPLLPLILYACAMFCAVIAWTSYIGIIQSNFNAADFQRAMLAAGPWRYSRYGEGFGLAILATLTLLPTMLVFTLFRNEVNKDVAKEEAAGAQQQAQFSGTAGAYPGAYTDGPQKPYYADEAGHQHAGAPGGGGGAHPHSYVAYVQPQPSYAAVAAGAHPDHGRTASAQLNVGVHGTHVEAPTASAQGGII